MQHDICNLLSSGSKNKFILLYNIIACPKNLSAVLSCSNFRSINAKTYKQWHFKAYLYFFYIYLVL